MKYERMITFTTKYDRHNVRCMGHLILKENDDPQAVMANHCLAKQIESYEVSPLLPHAAIVVRMYQAYYKCATRKRQHSCTKSVEQKEWLEQVVVEETVRHVLTDEHISLISTQAANLLQKEAADSSLLESLKGQLSSVTTSIGNIMKAIEQGIITTTTKNRLEELEEEKAQLEVRIAEEAISRPIVSADDIAFWLYTFRDGDTADPEYCRRVIDTLVSRVDVFDDGDGHRKFEIYYNLTSDARSTIKCSDKDSEAPLYMIYPNLIPVGNGFGFLYFIKCS